MRLAAQELANKEDTRILNKMELAAVVTGDLKHGTYITAKGELTKRNVKAGFGVAVDSEAQVVLETDSVGVRSGVEVVEQILSAKIAQSNALPEDLLDKDATATAVAAAAKGARTSGACVAKVDFVVFQATPAAYRVVHGSTPRLRVVSNDGKTVKLQLEEWIAVGELEKNRFVWYQRRSALPCSRRPLRGWCHSMVRCRRHPRSA